MNYKNIVIAGSGVLGSQIAFQCAYCGFNVTILTHSDKSKEKALEKLTKLKETYLETIKDMSKNEGIWARGIASLEEFDAKVCQEKVENGFNNIKFESDQKTALSDADLVIESINENIEDKKNFYTEIAPLLPEKTVIVTNSSTLLPSKLASFTGRPEKYLALHFANSIWKNNTAEVMAHSTTDSKYFDEVLAFAEAINMLPLPVKTEKSGYLLNSMLVPFLLSAMDLLANGVSDPESIDKAWTRGTGAPKGPFQIIDTVGLMTAKNIVEQYQKVPGLLNPLLKKMMLPYNYKGMLALLNKYIEEGKLGVSTGEGFYKYNK